MRVLKTLAAVTLMGTLAGCPSDTADTQLSQSQQQAVEVVSAKMMSAVESLTAGLPAVEHLGMSDGAQLGECPAVSLAAVDGVLEFSLDYGTGCMNELHGDAELSGAVAVTANFLGREFEVSFEELAIDDRSVDGTISLQFSNDGATGSANAEFDVSTAQSGSAEGELTLVLGPELGVLTAVQGAAALTDEAEAIYEVTVQNLVFDPVGNGNMIPEDGTISFLVPADGPGVETLMIVVRYLETSPIDGVVEVTVGSAQPVLHELPPL